MSYEVNLIKNKFKKLITNMNNVNAGISDAAFREAIDEMSNDTDADLYAASLKELRDFLNKVIKS